MRPASLAGLSAAHSTSGGSSATTRPLALSPSRAADFKQCPLLYRFRAIDRLPERKSVAQIRGTLVHAVLENLFDLPADIRTPGTAAELISGAWDSMCIRDPGLLELVPAAESDTFLAEANTLINRYFQMEDPRSFDAQSCELRVEFDLDGARMRGFIDRVDVAPTGEVRVVDYKTGRSPGALFEARALFQMKFYALAILRLRGTVPTRLQLMYLADGQQLRYTPDYDELERFARTLSAIWDAIKAAGRTGDFRPRRSSMCSFCEHQAICPEFGGTPPDYPGWPGDNASPRA